MRWSEQTWNLLDGERHGYGHKLIQPRGGVFHDQDHK